MDLLEGLPLYFLFLDSIGCWDSLALESLMQEFQPIFYVNNMTNYKEVNWWLSKALYGRLTTILENKT